MDRPSGDVPLLRRLGQLIRGLSANDPPAPLKDWFHVNWNDDAVFLDVAPPGSEPWSASFRWANITRVCFKAEDPFASDGIYIFTTDRPESYAIPTEADGGAALWDEILRRGLFDAELAIRAAGSPEGLFCWPPTDSDEA